ncbi:MAG: hypothetical protein AB1Z98_31980 [Nannocystaceae bacterium]
MRWSLPTSTTKTIGLAVGLGLGGCELAEPDADDPTLRTRAVVDGNQAVDGTPRLAYVGALFRAAPGLDPSDPDQARQLTVTAVHDRLAATFEVIGCDAELDTDDDTTIGLVLRGCRLLLWTLDAELEARAEIVTEACETEPCAATAIAWDLDIAELSSRVLDLPGTSFSGPAQLQAPVDPAQPMRWETFPGFVIETRLGRRLDTVSTASWTIDEDNCVWMDLGARLSLEDLDDDIDARVGNVVLSVRGLRRCPGRCESTGDVQLSFAAGQVVSWSHDGDDTITVITPRGRSIEVSLPCAEEREEASSE